jgi:glycine/D-amino acid oxidase-like deaminating enzyme/nitrite reductase/ring-hydroxylating ferredoxin subunit
MPMTAIALPATTESLWVATGPIPQHEPLAGDLTVSVAVLGAGITGLSAALLLQQAGADVALLDQSAVGTGATGYTTAKLSSLHGLAYAQLRSTFGRERAAAYAQANEDGLRRIADWTRDLRIDCDLRPQPNYVYAEQAKDLSDLQTEVDAANDAGLPAELVDGVPLPFDTAGGIRLENQAEFHPRKYLAGLAAAFTDQGGRIFEHTRAMELHEGRPNRIRTERGPIVTAEHVVVATHFPFLDRGLFFARMHAERSYSVAIALDGEPPPGMFINASEPKRSIRAHPDGAHELLLVGGEGHKVGQGHPTTPRYEALAEFAREHWGPREIVYRWSTQDNMPVDGLPYIGKLTPRSDTTYVASGYRKWGLAMGTAAAAILAERILGHDDPYEDAFDPNRLPPPAALKELATENANVGFHFFADRLTQRAPASADLQPGEGRVVSHLGRQLALSRDRAGALHAVSARCSHLGCIVAFNDAEQSWDCPCHASRFALDGSVLQGPAVHPLAPRELPE